jgi:hypothetical protein
MNRRDFLITFGATIATIGVPSLIIPDPVPLLLPPLPTPHGLTRRMLAVEAYGLANQ